MAAFRLCSVDGCDKRARTRGYCDAHYGRWVRHGDPTAGRTFCGVPNRYLEQTVLAHEADECFFWPYSRGGNGYAMLDKAYVHRIVCEKRHGPPPTPDHEAAHSCANGHLGCVSKMHLSWKTHADNMSDTVVHGTSTRGERQWQTNLTVEDVRLIRSLRGKITQREIGARFGIDQSAVSRIQTGDQWSWLVT